MRRGGASTASGAMGDATSAACVNVSKRWAGGAVTWRGGIGGGGGGAQSSRFIRIQCCSTAHALRAVPRLSAIPSKSSPNWPTRSRRCRSSAGVQRLHWRWTGAGPSSSSSSAWRRRASAASASSWTTFLVLYGDLAKELRAFVDVADAWLETLPNRPRRLQREESGAEADEDLDDGEGAS